VDGVARALAGEVSDVQIRRRTRFVRQGIVAEQELARSEDVKHFFFEGEIGACPGA
jgi:hypothetical protein